MWQGCLCWERCRRNRHRNSNPDGSPLLAGGQMEEGGTRLGGRQSGSRSWGLVPPPPRLCLGLPQLPNLVLCPRELAGGTGVAWESQVRGAAPGWPHVATSHGHDGDRPSSVCPARVKCTGVGSQARLDAGAGGHRLRPASLPSPRPPSPSLH